MEKFAAIGLTLAFAGPPQLDIILHKIMLLIQTTFIEVSQTYTGLIIILLHCCQLYYF